MNEIPQPSEFGPDLCQRTARLWSLPEVQQIAKEFYEYEMQSAHSKSDDIRWRNQFDSAYVYVHISLALSRSLAIQSNSLTHAHICLSHGILLLLLVAPEQLLVEYRTIRRLRVVCAVALGDSSVSVWLLVARRAGREASRRRADLRQVWHSMDVRQASKQALTHSLTHSLTRS